MAFMAAPAFAQGPPDCESSDTVVPGHCDREGTVNTHYTQESGGYDYVVNTRGDFGDDPYLDDGQIMNHIQSQENPGESFNYIIVHETSPQYDGENPIWGTWDIHVLTVPGEGNIARDNYED
jgi:hypothetical protein